MRQREPRRYCTSSVRLQGSCAGFPGQASEAGCRTSGRYLVSHFIRDSEHLVDAGSSIGAVPQDPQCATLRAELACAVLDYQYPIIARSQPLVRCDWTSIGVPSCSRALASGSLL